MCKDSFDHNFYYTNNYIKARKDEKTSGVHVYSHCLKPEGAVYAIAEAQKFAVTEDKL
jgi:hypothetical protein